MAYTIDNSWTRQYRDDAMHLASQRGSRLMNTVKTKQVTGRSLEIERIGSADAVAKAGRHAPTPEAEVPHSRRRANMSDYQWAEMIDETDRARMIIDPRAAYMKELASAYNRQNDLIVINALGGAAAQVDAAGTETNVTLPASQLIAAASTGMTVDKLMEARERLLSAEVDTDYEDCFVVLTARQEQELLSDPQLTSSDYSQIQRLISGDLSGEFMGFHFRRSEQLTTSGGGLTGGTTTNCFAYAGSAICFGTANEMKVRVGERADRSFSEQIYTEWTCGAVRVEDVQVVQIDCA